MSWNNIKQKIPEVFQRKIAVDYSIKEISKMDVIPLTAIKELKEEQSRIRMGCEGHIKRQKEDS